MARMRRQHHPKLPPLIDTAEPATTSQPSIQSATPQILQLQRQNGNAYVQRLLVTQSIQRQSAFAAPATQETTANVPSSAQRPMLSYGSQGPDVIYLQRRLNLYGANL